MSLEIVSLSNCYIWLTHCIMRMPGMVNREVTVESGMLQLYESGKSVFTFLQNQVSDTDAELASAPVNHKLRAELLRTLCFSATYGLLLNLKLQGSRLARGNLVRRRTLYAECNQLVSLITDVVNKATVYRPLGALYAALGLILARPVSDDVGHIDKLLTEFQKDYQGAKLPVMAIQAEALVRRLRES